MLPFIFWKAVGIEREAQFGKEFYKWPSCLCNGTLYADNYPRACRVDASFKRLPNHEFGKNPCIARRPQSDVLSLWVMYNYWNSQRWVENTGFRCSRYPKEISAIEGLADTAVQICTNNKLQNNTRLRDYISRNWNVARLSLIPQRTRVYMQSEQVKWPLV